MSRFIYIFLLITSVLAISDPASAAASLEVDRASGADGGSGSNFFTSCSAEVHSDVVDVCFNADGDYLVLQDEAQDAKRVGLQWRLTDGSRRGICWTDSGANLWFPTSGWAGPIMECNKNMIEGKTIEIRGGTCDYTTNNHCLTVENFGEWTGWDSATV